tara:strand:+ start:9 stop:536 length:528 start_codon:yes stop_codon:yes gene_type:complete
MKIVLFYSNKCKICESLTSFKSYDKLPKACVDNLSIRKKLPKYIKTVPSILIKDGENVNVLTGQEVYKWCQMMQNQEIGVNSNSHPENNNFPNNSNAPINNSDNSNTNELGTFDNLQLSDSFSFIDNTNLSTNNSSYSYIDMNDSSIPTPSSNNGNNNNEIDKKYDLLLQQRKNI